MTDKIYAITQFIDGEEVVVGRNRKLYTNFDEAFDSYKEVARHWFLSTLHEKKIHNNPPMLVSFECKKVLYPKENIVSEVHNFYNVYKTKADVLDDMYKRDVDALIKEFNNSLDDILFQTTKN